MQQPLIENKPLALFDVDGVLVKPWIIQYFSSFLASYDHPLFSLEIISEMNNQLDLYKKDSDYEQFARNWISSYASGICGQSVSDIELASDVFWQLHWDSFVYNYTVDMVKFVSQKCITVAITASPIEPVKSLCKKLGIEFVEALQVDSKDGIFTDVAVKNPNKKSDVVEKYARLIDDANIKRSLSFGDSISDYPLWASTGSSFMFMDAENSESFHKGMELYNYMKGKLPHLEILQRPISANAVQDLINSRIHIDS